jgi:hypothetical protein
MSLIAATEASAGEWDATGFFGVDARAFWQDSRYPGQDNELNGSIMVQPEWYWRDDAGRHRVSVVGFARVDSQDDERTHVDIREASWGTAVGSWDIVAGISKVFWGVAESRHLVDVINQTDLVEDIDQEEKLGQPMVNVNLQKDFGRFEFFVLPYFRERTFPGPDGRLRPPLPVDADNAIYESSNGEQHVDFALRYSHYIGAADLALYVFDGTSREPRFVPGPGGDSLTPYYEQMTQVGFEFQYTHEAWLWKLETMGRDTRDDSFVAAVGGFEYTFYGVRDSNADIGVLMEVLYDGRSANAPPTLFDNDIFVGTRLAFNDVQNSSVLAGIAMDTQTHELFLNVEAERRFGDSLSAGFRLRAFTNATPGDGLYTFERDDYLQLTLSWYY